jgi:hypothetical protein
LAQEAFPHFDLAPARQLCKGFIFIPLARGDIANKKNLK